MTDESIVRVDAKGRVTLPKAIRDELNIQDGTPFFVKFIKGKGVVILAPAINPFDILAEQAIGISISYYEHHRHSFYIILNSRLAGFTHRETLLAAAIAASIPMRIQGGLANAL